MASWGRISDVALTGTGATTAESNVVTGTGTLFTTEVEVNQLLNVGTEAYIVTAINSDLELEVIPVAEASAATLAMAVSDAPKYLPLTEIDHVTLVDVAEINTTTRADGIKTPGWTLYEEYGSGRKRVETLVAMKQTSE